MIAFNDQMALGVLAGMIRRGVGVPEQMSIVGCDDVPVAAMVAPPLTTIRMPTDEAGTAAVESLADSTAKVEAFRLARGAGVDGFGRGEIQARSLTIGAAVGAKVCSAAGSMATCGDPDHRFKAGHRIRLLIAGGSLPRFDRSLGTGRGSPGRRARWRRRPSTIDLAATSLTMPVGD